MELRHIVRVAATEMKGQTPLKLALTKIKGVGPMVSNAIIEVLKLDPEKKIGAFEDEELAELEEAIHKIHEHDIPEWMLNRKKDPQTGENLHLVSSDLTMQQSKDIGLMTKKKSYRGLRHAWGLKVRGQRTKSTGRGGTTVGVQRKRIKRQMEKKKKK